MEIRNHPWEVWPWDSMDWCDLQTGGLWTEKKHEKQTDDDCRFSLLDWFMEESQILREDLVGNHPIAPIPLRY